MRRNTRIQPKSIKRQSYASPENISIETHQTSNWKQHKMAPTINDLPIRAVEMVCDYLTNDDVFSLHGTSQQLYANTLRRFARLHWTETSILIDKISMGLFKDIISRPTFARAIRILKIEPRQIDWATHQERWAEEINVDFSPAVTFRMHNATMEASREQKVFLCKGGFKSALTAAFFKLKNLHKVCLSWSEENVNDEGDDCYRFLGRIAFQRDLRMPSPGHALGDPENKFEQRTMTEVLGALLSSEAKIEELDLCPPGEEHVSRYLDLVSLEAIDDNALVDDTMSSLKVLNITSEVELDDDQERPITNLFISRMPKLEQLWWKAITTAIGDWSLRRHIPSGPDSCLRSLRVEKCTVDKNESITFFGSLSHLKSLTLIRFTLRKPGRWKSFLVKLRDNTALDDVLFIGGREDFSAKDAVNGRPRIPGHMCLNNCRTGKCGFTVHDRHAATSRAEVIRKLTGWAANAHPWVYPNWWTGD
jgi:hypothetical protein